MRLRMRMRAGLAGWRDEHADSDTPIFEFAVFSFSSFGLMALQLCIKYKAPVRLLQGAGDRRSGSRQGPIPLY